MDRTITYTAKTVDGQTYTSANMFEVKMRAEEHLEEMEKLELASRLAENKKAERAFFKKINIDLPEDNPRTYFHKAGNNITWLVVNRKGEYVDTLCASHKEMIAYNVANNTLAHNVEAMLEKNASFYDMSYLEIFKSLSWNTTKIQDTELLLESFGTEKIRLRNYMTEINGHFYEFKAKSKNEALELLASLDIPGCKLV